MNKFIFGIIVILIVASLYTWFTWGQSKNLNNDSSLAEYSEKPVDETEQNNPIGDTSLKSAAIQNTNSGKHAKIDYNDNWCVARQDLSDEDLQLARKEKKDWERSRNIAFFDQNGTGDGFNSELIEPYHEMDSDDLVALASKDNPMALLTLLRRPNVSQQVKEKSAINLVILGDTSSGLTSLVSSSLSNARSEFRLAEEANNNVKEHLIRALALVQYGMSRYDTTALRYFLSFSESEKQFDYNFDTSLVLNAADYLLVEEHALNFVNGLNKVRERKNLPTIESIEVPKIAKHMHKQRIANIYRRFETLVTSDPVSYLWNDSYLSKDTCIERLIAP